ncbi:MAG: DUF4369 domain-containing protein [Bacteroidales bacterium]|nr:DUF4369 domain-containing protein [Bacteroidales bacterium]
MKRLKMFVFCLLTVFLFFACRQDKVLISGVFENSDKPYFVLLQIAPDELIPVDTVLLLKGRFSCRIKTDQAGVYLMRFSDTSFISFIANKGDKLSFTGDVANLNRTYSVQGNEESELLLLNRRKLDELYDKTKILSKEFISHTGRSDFDSVKNRIDSIYQVNFELHKRYLTDCMLAHPNRLASLLAFYQKLGNNAFFTMKEDKDLLKTIYPALAKAYPDNLYIKDLEEKLAEQND